MVTASNNRVTQRTNKTVSFSSLYWCSFNLQVTNIRASSQVFHVPPSRSGDAGARTGDQHRFIVPERCQSPARHDGLTLRPGQYIQSKKVIKIPTLLFGVPGHGPYGHTRLGHNNLQIIKHSLQTTKEIGGVPFWPRGVKRSRPATMVGHPSSLLQLTQAKIFRNIAHGRRYTLRRR